MGRETPPSTQLLARGQMLGDLIDELVADAEAQETAIAEGRTPGPVSRLPELDRTLGGYFRPGLHGFTGDPGAGKTALSLQIAGTCGTPAVYVTAEQSPTELLRKVISRVTLTPLEEVRGASASRVRELATIAARSAPSLLLLDATRGPAPATLLEEVADELRQRWQSRDVLLVIDALQPWARGLGDGSEYDLIQSGLSDLVRVVSKLRAAALVLSHRTRASAGTRKAADAQNSTLTASKGSADFEHLVDCALHLSVEAGKGSQFCAGKRVNVHVGKNRYGPTDITLVFPFDGARQRFGLPDTVAGAVVTRPVKCGPPPSTDWTPEDQAAHEAALGEMAAALSDLALIAWVRSQFNCVLSLDEKGGLKAEGAAGVPSPVRAEVRRRAKALAAELKTAEPSK
jgi:replicative DNA helicase